MFRAREWDVRASVRECELFNSLPAAITDGSRLRARANAVITMSRFKLFAANGFNGTERRPPWRSVPAWVRKSAADGSTYSMRFSRTPHSVGPHLFPAVAAPHRTAAPSGTRHRAVHNELSLRIRFALTQTGQTGRRSPATVPRNSEEYARQREREKAREVEPRAAPAVSNDTRQVRLGF